MLFFKSSRKQAKDLLSTAYKVYNYRCDVMSQGDAKEMFALIGELEELIGDGKAVSPEFDALEKKLEPLMRKNGGNVYPLSTWADYVDMIVVAGIVALGIRSFFLQPFKIPTNSMYPSFYGTTSHVYKVGDETPSFAKKIVRRVFQAASNYSLKADRDGDLLIEINNPIFDSKNGAFAFEWVDSRDMFIIPTKSRQYSFDVAGTPKTLTLPAEFPIDEIIVKAFPNLQSQQKVVLEKDGKMYLKLGSFKKGETVLNFDLLGGDMLFVDRVTYNFRKPKIGDSFVFLTKYCDGLTRLNNGVPDDKYYIKRLVGKGGDTLQVSGSKLLVNGVDAKGSVAFEANAKKIGKYCGYVADGVMKDEAKIIVPQKSYWAMGDNSQNSLDSRYWGEVPQKAVVGKALIIFYPFTDRWGATK